MTLEQRLFDCHKRLKLLVVCSSGLAHRHGFLNYRTFLMTSTITVTLLSGFVSCAIASGAITEQISSDAISTKLNSARTAPSQPAPTKSWERSTLRIPLPTTATNLKFSEDGERLFTSGATEQSAELWSVTTGNRISAFPAKSGFALCF